MNSPLSVDGSDFRFTDGDYVLSIASDGSVRGGGRVFEFVTAGGFRFVTEDRLLSGHARTRMLIRDERWLGKSGFPRAHIYSTDASSFEIRKVYCPICRCYVKLDGHRERCVVKQSGDVVDMYRRHAWVGDALHLMDVRMSLLGKGVATADLDRRLQTYTSGAAQADYVRTRGVEGMRHPPLGDSERQLSTAFEASYSGAFRSAYVRDVLEMQLPLYGLLDTGDIGVLLTPPPSYHS